MKHEGGRSHEVFNEGGIADIALVDFDLVFDVGDVGCRASGHVVEDRDLVALGKQCITEVRTDKTGYTGDENAHEVKSNGAGCRSFAVGSLMTLRKLTRRWGMVLV